MSNTLHKLLALVVLAIACQATAWGGDPLPSWRDGESKQAIMRFVAAVSDKDGPDYVAPDARIAVFDNDGTLWSEQPMYFQLAFVLDRVRALAPANPEWKQQQPFKAALEGDIGTVLEGGEHALLELVMATHAGTTTDEFSQIVEDWLASARHPDTGRAYTDMVYQPMLELLD